MAEASAIPRVARAMPHGAFYLGGALDTTLPWNSPQGLNTEASLISEMAPDDLQWRSRLVKRMLLVLVVLVGLIPLSVGWVFYSILTLPFLAVASIVAHKTIPGSVPHRKAISWLAGLVCTAVLGLISTSVAFIVLEWGPKDNAILGAVFILTGGTLLVLAPLLIASAVLAVRLSLRGTESRAFRWTTYLTSIGLTIAFVALLVPLETFDEWEWWLARVAVAVVMVIFLRWLRERDEAGGALG